MSKRKFELTKYNRKKFIYNKMKLKMDVDLDDIEARKMLGLNTYNPSSFY